MRRFFLLVAGMIGVAGTAAAQAPQAETLRELFSCRALSDQGARLACYDRRAASLEEASRRRDIAVVDTRVEQQRRRESFGAPTRGNADAPSITEIHSTLVSAVPSGSGAYVFTLADGARWMQADDAPLGGRLRAGEAVTVRRTMLGGYKIKVGRRAAVKARRL